MPVNLPVQTESMKESRQALHDQQDCHCQGSKSSKYDEQNKTSTQTSHTEADVDDHGPEHLRKLCREKSRKNFDYFRMVAKGNFISLRVHWLYSNVQKYLGLCLAPQEPEGWFHLGCLYRTRSACSQVTQDLNSNSLHRLQGQSSHLLNPIHSTYIF